MKYFKYILIVIISFTLVSIVYARDSNEGKGKIIKKLISKRQDLKKNEPLPEGIAAKYDIPYIKDNDPGHVLDIYRPEGKNGPLTVLFHIHGGGWRTGDKNMMFDTGVFYASQGFIFITPNYRLSPEYVHPAHIEDCAAALAWTFGHLKELGGDKTRVFVSGHSAGAHLAALLGTNNKYLQKYNINLHRLAGVIPVDTASFNLISNKNEKPVKKMIEEAFGTDKEMLKDASPFYNIAKEIKYPDFLVLNTTNRRSAAKEAEKFVKKLKNTGCNARFIPVDNHTHSEMATGMFDLSDPVGSAILRFLKQ